MESSSAGLPRSLYTETADSFNIMPPSLKSEATSLGQAQTETISASWSAGYRAR